ncbi:hypothetical protein [Pseudorhodoferax sp. Leaf274]|uniref:hypothetical protein n=1 Tax=Pseudorhodoferax sp. Leaf274 TaxID=1736318 RepID=UPI000702C631|nr:hypothetical protein [Pseudorhodoferax sp. Leaf274]KQP39685.1 hypothetical protein ASF44_08110 [Pseudorhodoferax sp. Leaf274]
MADFDWRKFVSGVAPALGTALGGPLAGAAIKVLAGAVLGDENASEADVAAAISSGQLTGEQIVSIKAAEQAFAVRMRELDIDVEKLNQAADEAVMRDVQDARARQTATKDWMPQVIFFMLAAAWAGTLALFYFAPLPVDEFLRALIVRAYATVETGLTGAIAYFIGSSRGSKASGDAVRKIAEQAGR